MSSEWLGGKPAGCISISQDKYIQIVFPRSTHLPTSNFIIAKYKDKEDTMATAVAYRHKISDELGITKNKYRYITEIDGSRYLEVQLQNDLVMKCEVEHLPQVSECIWSANKLCHNNSYYVKTRSCEKRTQEFCIFHRLVYPEFTEIYHINNDSLDNRRTNIRDARIHIGVYFIQAPKALWRAQWLDSNGKKHIKSFSYAIHGKAAYTKACECRDINHRG